MGENLPSDVAPVHRRRRLMYKQFVPDGVFGTPAASGAVPGGSSVNRIGSHAHLPALPIIMNMDGDDGVLSGHQQGAIDHAGSGSPAGFPRLAYNRLYGRVARWVRRQPDAAIRKVWARCKMRREVGKGLLPEQKTMLRAFLHAHPDLADEDRLLLDRLADGVLRRDFVANLQSSWKRVTTQLFTHNGDWGLVPSELYQLSDGVRPLGECARHIAEAPWYASLQQEFVGFVSRLCMELGIREWA